MHLCANQSIFYVHVFISYSTFFFFILSIVLMLSYFHLGVCWTICEEAWKYGYAVTRMRSESAWMRCNAQEKRNSPKVKQAKEMSSKCHLNKIWPFGCFHQIKVCASLVPWIWVKNQAGPLKRSIKISFEINLGLKIKINTFHIMDHKRYSFAKNTFNFFFFWQCKTHIFPTTKKNFQLLDLLEIFLQINILNLFPYD